MPQTANFSHFLLVFCSTRQVHSYCNMMIMMMMMMIRFVVCLTDEGPYFQLGPLSETRSGFEPAQNLSNCYNSNMIEVTIKFKSTVSPNF